MITPRLKGFYDVSPWEKETWKRSAAWHYFNATASKTCEQFGYQFIQFPLLELQQLFEKSAGTTSDVSKEMYTFEDRAGRTVALRPEGTPSTVRLLRDVGVLTPSFWGKVAYQGPMFRYERPQAGRFRQFSQFGCESLGGAGLVSDVEIILLGHTLLQALNIPHTLELNYLGDDAAKMRLQNHLYQSLLPLKSQLTPTSQQRLETNPLRILDTKDRDELALLNTLDLQAQHLTDAQHKYYDQLCSQLTQFSVPFVHNPRLVRGLDYYTGVVFEFCTNRAGAQNAILSGGRYDTLCKTIAGVDLPAVGFAAGVERLLAAIDNLPTTMDGLIALLPLEASHCTTALQLAQQLRQQGHRATVEENIGKKIPQRLARSEKLGAQWAAFLGENEVQQKILSLKSLLSGKQCTVAWDQLQAMAWNAH